jgi:hypothetical protein
MMSWSYEESLAEHIDNWFDDFAFIVPKDFPTAESLIETATQVIRDFFDSEIST